MIDGKKFFDQPIKSYVKYMKKFERLQLVKEMIAQLVAWYVIVISKNIK